MVLLLRKNNKINMLHAAIYQKPHAPCNTRG